MYCDNIALPHNFLIISLNIFENKCFSDGIRNLKREKKNSKGGFEPGSLCPGLHVCTAESIKDILMPF